MGLVGVQGAQVTVSQLQGRVCFPRVVEAVDPFQLDRAGGGDDVSEHPAPPDGLQLAGITDQRQPPMLVFGEFDQAMQIAGGEHPGLVDDQRAPCREPPRWMWAVRPRPLVEQFGDGVGAHAGLAFKDTRGLGVRGDTEQIAAVTRQVGHGGAQHRGLAATDGADHHHQPVPAGNRGGGVALQHV